MRPRRPVRGGLHPRPPAAGWRPWPRVPPRATDAGSYWGCESRPSPAPARRPDETRSTAGPSRPGPTHAGSGPALQRAANWNRGAESLDTAPLHPRTTPPTPAVPPPGRRVRSVFFASASGSITDTTTARPARRRRRCAVPVSHHDRCFCHVNPAPLSTCRIVAVLIWGNPLWRKARRRVRSDHTAVPSRSRSGARRASARMRSRSATV